MSKEKNQGSAWTLSAGKVNSATAKLIDEFGDKGADIITKIDEDPAFRRRIVNLAKSGGYLPTTPQERAQKIMGWRYLGPDVAMQHLGVQYTDQELVALAVVPFAEPVLKACAATHILVAGAPLSILDIRERIQAQGKGKLFYSKDDARYNTEKFVKDEKVSCQWYLIRKEAVADSTNKNWNEQQALLTPEEITPRACEVVYTTILALLGYRGWFLIEAPMLARNFVHCSDVSSCGNHAYVGYNLNKGLTTLCYAFCPEDRGMNLGLAARRK